MGSGQALSDVIKTTVICTTVAFLGYLGFQLLSKPGNKGKATSTALQPDSVERANEAIEVFMLAAENDAEEVRVWGRLVCRSGSWQKIELAFTFRGRNNVRLHTYHYVLPGVKPETPLEGGITREFEFRIPKFPRHEKWLEHNVQCAVRNAVPK